MRGSIAVAALMVVLAGCASLEPAGRNASRGERPPPPPVAAPAPAPVAAPAPRAAPAPAPQVVTPPPAPAPAAQAPVAAPNVTAPPAPRTARAAGDDDIVVPGEVNRQVPAPGGDPRSVAERRADIRSWDECLTRAQAGGERDPMRAQLDTPEEYCAEALGMANRNAVPISRRVSR